MQVYLVGGAVRDALLDRHVTERDYVVVGATPKEMLQKGFTQVGKDFPVFLHPKTGEEYALARTERKSGKGYTGFVCDASSDVTLEEDLKRRDLTVNAMAQSAQGSIIDPYNGQRDLQNRILRHVSEAFSEDPLRVFRIARFAARYTYLGFTIAAETKALMTEMAQSGELQSLSAERVWQETKRSLLEGNPEVFFEILASVGALQTWFVELESTLSVSIATLKTSVQCQNIIAAEQSTDPLLPLLIRFTSLVVGLNDSDVEQLCNRLKVQNQVSEVAILASKFKATLLQTSIEKDEEASNLLSLFNGTDAWRRPERFSQILSAFTPYALTQSNNWEYRKQEVISALNAANSVNVQDIIAKGFKGPQIREALNTEKLAVIEGVISVQPHE